MSERTLLLVTADPQLARQVAELARYQFHIALALASDSAEQQLHGIARLGVFLVDHAPSAAAADAVRLLQRAQELRPEARRGLLTGYGDVGQIVRAVHSDAAQFVLHRPVVPAELLAALAHLPAPDVLQGTCPAGAAA